MSIPTSVIDLSLLKAHERTLEQVELELADKILREGVFFRAVSVDDKHYVILDGHHRYIVFTKVLKEKNFKKILAAKIRYFTDRVILEKWYRFIPLEKKIDINLIMSHTDVAEKMTLERAHPSDFVRECDHIIQREGALGMFLDLKTCKAVLLEARADTVLELYDDLENIENNLRKIGCEVQYHRKELESITPKSGYLLIGPKVEKEDVITVGLSGELFAPKSTRHIICDRIDSKSIPLDELV